MSSFVPTSLTECFTGLPNLFGSWFLVAPLLRLIVVPVCSSIIDSSEKPGGEFFHMFLGHRVFCIECFLRCFCKPLVSTWSASFSHSSGAISCFWNAFRNALGDVSLLIRLMAAFGLTLSGPLELPDWSWGFLDSAYFGADSFSAAVAAFFFSCIRFFPFTWLQFAPEFSAKPSLLRDSFSHP